MNENISRRKFIRFGSVLYTLATVGGTSFVACVANAVAQTKETNKSVPARPARLSADLVNEFVIAGHGKFEQVKKLLAQEPRLINAAWDWGGGDWETALGGAAHTGNKEIARYLLVKGARIDLFAAAMLGNLDIVKAAITAFPESRNAPGPHGITLLAHAKAGGAESINVVKYLETLN